MNKQVECPIHGLNDQAYICQHLNLNDKIGFHEAYDPQNPCSRVLQGWCQQCNDILMEEWEWNDRVTHFAKLKLICLECFNRIKEFNRNQ